MPDGVAAKGAAKANKPKASGSRVDQTPGGFFGRIRKKLFSPLARFLRESYIEVVKKASWPSRAELYKFTAVVIFAVAVVGIWIGGLDAILTVVSNKLGFGIGAKR